MPNPFFVAVSHSFRASRKPRIPGAGQEAAETALASAGRSCRYDRNLETWLGSW